MKRSLAILLVFALLLSMTVATFAAGGAGSIKTTDKDNTINNQNHYFSSISDVYFRMDGFSADKYYVRVVQKGHNSVVFSSNGTTVSHAGTDQHYKLVDYITVNSDVNDGPYIVQVSSNATFKNSKHDMFKVRAPKDPDSTTPPTQSPAPAFLVTKRAYDPDNSQDVVALTYSKGMTIQYQVVIENKGNTILTDLVLTDTHSDAGATMAIGTIDVGGFATQKYTYTVTEADADAGYVVNVATVDGKYSFGEGDSTVTGDLDEQSDSWTVDFDYVYKINVTKVVDENSDTYPTADPFGFTLEPVLTQETNLIDASAVDTQQVAIGATYQYMYTSSYPNMTFQVKENLPLPTNWSFVGIGLDGEKELSNPTGEGFYRFDMDYSDEDPVTVTITNTYTLPEDDNGNDDDTDDGGDNDDTDDGGDNDGEEGTGQTPTTPSSPTPSTTTNSTAPVAVVEEVVEVATEDPAPLAVSEPLDAGFETEEVFVEDAVPQSAPDEEIVMTVEVPLDAPELPKTAGLPLMMLLGAGSMSVLAGLSLKKRQ